MTNKTKLRAKNDAWVLYRTVFSYQPGSASKNEVHRIFLIDVRKTLGAERSTQLFQAIRSYKTTDNYESLVATVVSLFTEKDEDFKLLISKFCLITASMCVCQCFSSFNHFLIFSCLIGFGDFIRPHHKKQYKEMLDSLIGQSADVAVHENQQTGGKGQPTVMWCI